MHLLFLPHFPLHRADIVFLLGLSFHLLFLCLKTKKRWKESWETDYEPGGQVPSRLPASGHNINIGLAGIRELVNGLTVRPWAPFLSLSRRCLGQPSDAVTGVPFFFLHFHLKIEEKKKVGTPVNQASRRWLHHVGPTVSAWFFLLLLFPSHREEGRGRRKRRKQERYHGHGHLWNKVQDRDSCQIAWFLTSFSTLLSSLFFFIKKKKKREEKSGWWSQSWRSCSGRAKSTY